ncbi:MAG: Asp-tRNA(Asn)/Glu-tRNA(Gln) amidotransferase subunit GatC [Phycisphaerae bacterium]|nr:Asp-tRNA(Asn)/Glu-tRNA(Gln) amidotransferase subunit GatC [Phycisphaerae bacterium]
MSTPESLTPHAVRHVAKLARLRLNEHEVEQYGTQLAAILGHISQLNAVNVDDVEPMAHPFASSDAAKMTNRLDDDVPTAPMPIEDLLMNAPAVEGRYLAVPKVLGEGIA